ncbi:unnamed protein product [Ilex paraguariensis]|uniref:REF/SRPP-like protein n=1 Tax=Ilex paraguariensis TaxID=185542 RepID=A0ABC8RH58_9AQUA
MKNNDQELKHLEFVRLISINALVCVSYLYEFAKQNSGPLKSTVGTVEKAATTVIGPVYEKLKSVPGDLLVFLDQKVDEATTKFDEHAPPLAKKVVCQAQSMVQKASQVAQTLVQEAQVGGPNAALRYACTLSKQFVFSQLAVVMYEVNRWPPLHAVAQMAVPTAAHLAENYNKVVSSMAAKGYSIFSYFPLVPINKMSKGYKQQAEAAATPTKEGDAATSIESESDEVQEVVT